MTRLAVFSYKDCWSSVKSPSGYATDGGFPFQMKALSQLFDSTTLVIPLHPEPSRVGEVPLEGHNLKVISLAPLRGSGMRRKVRFLVWLLTNAPTILREVWRADVVHTPIPADVGTAGMLLAFLLRKPLFVRHCGNWTRPVTAAEHFWKWFMERYAGGRNVMLATGGSTEPPSRINRNVRWIFSTTLTERELDVCRVQRDMPTGGKARLVIVCRQDREKGTGTVIESLPLILANFPDASLDVVGDGPSLRVFKELAADLGVSDRVEFHGKLDHDGVINLLRRSDAFCYPTQASEGFPKVVLEALACGLPVIATRVSVLPELLGTGCGVLLEEPTPRALATAVSAILKDQDRYRSMSRRAIETAGQYSLEQWRDRIGELLSSEWAGRAKVRHIAIRVNA